MKTTLRIPDLADLRELAREADELGVRHAFREALIILTEGNVRVVDKGVWDVYDPLRVVDARATVTDAGKPLARWYQCSLCTKRRWCPHTIAVAVVTPCVYCEGKPSLKWRICATCDEEMQRVPLD